MSLQQEMDRFYVASLVSDLRVSREASEFYDRYDAPYDRAAEALRGEFSDEEIEVVCRVLRRMSRSLMEGDHAQR